MQCYYLAIKCTEVTYKSVVCVCVCVCIFSFSGGGGGREGGSLLEYLRFLLVTCKVSAGSLKMWFTMCHGF